LDAPELEQPPTAIKQTMTAAILRLFEEAAFTMRRILQTFIHATVSRYKDRAVFALSVLASLVADEACASETFAFR
jgi:hypothetical protein